jgi:hypothetical protein
MFYKLIFYQFYLTVKFFRDHIKNHLFTGDLKFDSLLLFSAFEFLNVYSLFSFFRELNLLKYFTIFFMVSIVLTGGVNYLYLLRGDRFERLINEVKSKNPSYKMLAKIFTIFYAIATCYFFYILTLALRCF